MMGRMMQMPLLISSLLTHAERHAGDTEVVSKRVEGDLHRTTWAGVAQRSRQLAQALARLGCEPGQRVGTLAWNGHRHLEIYYGTSGSGLVCHTINPRLFPEQIAWIVQDAADAVLCFDLSFLPLVEKLAPSLTTVRHLVLMTDREHMPAASTLPGLLCYEELLAAEDGRYHWPDLDENTASSICYTSGTTGHPKGAVYSHRSSVLHAYAAALPDAMNCASQDVILPVVPMFHVNAWGIPYAAALVGAKLVLPGPHLDGKSLYELFEGERVSFSAGVPTVWLGLITYMKAQGLKFSHFRRTVIGGSACPPAMMKTLQEDFGVEVIHAWGMTELSPLGTLSKLKSKHLTLPAEARQRLLEKQGRVIYGIDMAIIDDDGVSLPWDGKSSGNLVVRGGWVIERYLGSQASPLVSVDGQPGWFPTGDVATIDADGFMQITDRSKDVIKSGGEWISSIDLENVAMAHPAVHEAAVIAARHPKWDERPLLVVVRKPGASLSREDMLAFYEGRIAKWQIPDDVVFVEEIPHTATGKIQKLKLREQFRGHALPTG
ncbi:3-(methylthio)propionyl-CoA ligase [Ideonella livida]|uniref:Fatty-acid--CoA ligase n=1 Tax=Ideonella livida TaxID=2707176 RepID=A0A7C9THV1_9BURK|nr:fatty-acid--CoA ligase [Ideonella livida]